MMLENVIVLILVGSITIYACAPKFCVSRNELRCMECSDPDDDLCTETNWVYCDDDAVERTYARLGKKIKDLKAGKTKYTNGKYKYVCYLNKLYKHANFTELEVVVRGCAKGIPFNGARNYGVDCRCARDFCNGYEEQPFSERGEPWKFYSPPYNYQKYDKNGDHLYCPKPEDSKNSTTKKPKSPSTKKP